MNNLAKRLYIQLSKYNLTEGEYIWSENETGGKLECLYDPTPKELQDFLKDYPICKAVSNGYGNWIFAYGQKICHDTLDDIFEHYAKINHWPIKYPRYEDSHLSVTRQGQILGYRESGSFEASLYGVFDLDDIDEQPYDKKECYYNLRSILAALKSLKKKYSWFKPSSSLIEELQALKNVKHLKYTEPSWYRW